jgi:hypothetical protein
MTSAHLLTKDSERKLLSEFLGIGVFGNESVFPYLLLEQNTYFWRLPKAVILSSE